MSKSYVGPKVPKWPLARERNTFSKTVFLRLCESRRQPNKIMFGPSRPSQKLFRTLDKPSCFVQARASKTTTLKQCAPFQRNSTVWISRFSWFCLLSRITTKTIEFFVCESVFYFLRISFRCRLNQTWNQLWFLWLILHIMSIFVRWAWRSCWCWSR